MLYRTILLILFPLGLIAQDTMLLTGRIINFETGESIGGVNVVIMGTAIGGASSATGRYEVKFDLTRISSDSISVLVSHVGYTIARITLPLAPGISVIDFRMRPVAVPLPEVVVEANRAKTTDWAPPAGVSMRVIGRKELDKMANNNVSQILTRVAGIRIVETGRDRSIKKLRIRGREVSPLIVIDDVPFHSFGGDSDIIEILRSVNVNDIERIEIVKGSGMFFRFGDAAMYGCVMIYTRKF